MRFGTICLMTAALAFSSSAMAGTTLQNPSFEEGTYNGWDTALIYTNVNSWNHTNGQALTTDQTGRSDQPLGQGLVAKDGTYFAGLCHAGLDPLDPNYIDTGGSVKFRQAIDVSSFSPTADRTNYRLQLWALLAATQDGFTDGNVSQAYTIYWQDEGSDFYDNLIITSRVNEGDTVAIDLGGAHERIYEFDMNGTPQSNGQVLVNVATGAITANVAITGSVADADTVTIDTAPVTRTRVYEYDVRDGSGVASGNVPVSVSTVTATVTISGNNTANAVSDGDTIEIDTGGTPRVYEFDTNGAFFAGHGGQVLVDVSGGRNRVNALKKLRDAINTDGANVPCTASYVDTGGTLTMGWKTPASGGVGHTNLNTYDALNKISVTNFTTTGTLVSDARTALVAAINGDTGPTGATCTAALAGANITLTWSGGSEGNGAANASSSSSISTGSFGYAGRDPSNAAIAMYNAIRDDPSSPCAVDRILDNYTRIVLKWKYTAGVYAGAAMSTNAATRISVTDNSGLFKSVLGYPYGFNHEYHLGTENGDFGGGGAGGGGGFFNDQAFAQYGKPNGANGATPIWTEWRKVHLIGSIPGKAGQVILEIKLSCGNVTEYNCFDGVSFTAWSGTGSSILGTFTSDINNGDFEDSGFDASYSYDPNGNGDPTAWGWGALDPVWANLDPAQQHLEPPNSIYMNGFQINAGAPLETYTTGHDSAPPNAMGTAAPSGSHFLGRCRPAGTGLGDLLDGYWGKVLPVRNWSECATGIRWYVHYYTKMYADGNVDSYQWLEFCWDAGGTVPNTTPPELFYSVLDYPGYYDDGSKFVSAAMLTNNLFSYIRPLSLYKMGTAGTTSSASAFDEIEQIGEFSSPLKPSGTVPLYTPYAPKYVLVRHHGKVISTGGTSEFKLLYDKIDIAVEATYGGARPGVVTDSTSCPSISLPHGQCPAQGTPHPYSGQLVGNVILSGVWTLAIGNLPPGLTLHESGLIDGQPRVAGTTTFTVQVRDTYDNQTATGQVSITVDGPCCNAPQADLNDDGYVDMTDFALLQACMTNGAGYTGGITSSCQCADLSQDGLAINDLDVGRFMECAKGPAVEALPVAPNCE